MSQITEQEILDVLTKDFADSEIIVKDQLGDGYSFDIFVKSTLFNNLIKVKQHQLVMSSLKELLSYKLHAVTIKTQKTK